MSNPPNMLILLADQLRYDALSCNAAHLCRTPAMDSVSAAGVRFANVYTPIALCTPARASLLTGRYPHNHRQLSNMGNFNGVFDDQLIGQPTLLSHLAGAGYRIGYTGKWHLPREGDGALWGVHRWHTPSEWLRSLDVPDYEFARREVQRLEGGGGGGGGGGRIGAVRRSQHAAGRADPGGVDGGPRDRDDRRPRRQKRALCGHRLLLRSPLSVRCAGTVRLHVRP